MLDHLGTMLSQLGVILGDFGAILGLYWAIMRLLWGYYEAPSWAYLGTILALCWVILELSQSCTTSSRCWRSMQVLSTCMEQMSMETSQEGTKTQKRSSHLAAKMPYKNNGKNLRECEMGQRRRYSTRPQPLSFPLLLLMLCFCFCTAAGHPLHPPKCFGNFGEDDVSDGNLAAFNYLCPLGTLGGSNLTVALTSHGLLPCMRFTSLAAARSGSCAEAVGVPTAVQGQDSWPREGRLENMGCWTWF